MKVNVLIPTNGRPELLAETLKSLRHCVTKISFDLTVVENGPVAGAREIVDACREYFPNGRLDYMYVSKANKSDALNVALMSKVREGLVVFFDDDVIVRPGTILAYVESATKSGERSFFGGQTTATYEVSPPQWLKKSLPLSAKGLSFDSDEGYGDCSYLGFNWAAYAEDLRSVGGFDSRFGPGSPLNCTGQESDMQQRLLSLGYVGVAVPDAVVEHYVPVARCNPKWAISRHYRAGLRKGVQKEFYSRRSIYRWFCRVVLEFIGALPTLRKELVFLALCRIVNALGAVWAREVVCRCRPQAVSRPKRIA